MRKTLLTATALAALIIAAPVSGQDASQPAPDPNAPAANEMVKTPGADTTLAAVQKPKFIGQQVETEILASNVMGATVFNPADESLGDVNDIVLTEDGAIVAVVVGVGGFLGIGEKNVAISFDAITETMDADGNPKLVLNATKEELDAAPPYVTVAMLKQEELDRKTMELTAPPAVPTQ